MPIGVGVELHAFDGLTAESLGEAEAISLSANVHQGGAHGADGGGQREVPAHLTRLESGKSNNLSLIVNSAPGQGPA